MGVKSTTETIKGQEIEDDVTTDEKSEGIDASKLEALKNKMSKKQEIKTEIKMEPTKSIRFGVIGSGQAGGRLSSEWFKLGYPAVAINTAPQDLAHIELPEENKLLLDHGLGGAAKELDIGASAADTYRKEIDSLINRKLGNAQVLLFCTSLGGGSGAGSVETVVELLSGMDMPVVVMTVLPKSSDDAKIKDNAVQTLAKLTNMVTSNKICNLIVADNAKIETIYSDVGPLNFFPVSNQAMIEPIDKFNTLSSMPSPVTPLDPTEFGKMFTDGGGLTVYGTIKVSNYEDETAIAEAVIEDLNNSLLASGFDLKQAKYAGTIFTASEKVWNKIPNASVDYAMSLINEACGIPSGIFQGIYAVDTNENVVTVYSMFSGLGLPDSRIQQLRNEAKESQAKAQKKDQERNLTLKLDVGDQTVNAAEEIKKRIQNKKSKFGGLVNKAVIDRRKK